MILIDTAFHCVTFVTPHRRMKFTAVAPFMPHVKFTCWVQKICGSLEKDVTYTSIHLPHQLFCLIYYFQPLTLVPNKSQVKTRLRPLHSLRAHSVQALRYQAI
jgi:hypothetical protein